MSLENKIASFQGSLLNLLASSRSVEETQAAIAEQKEFDIFRDDISAWRPEMLEVAAILVKKWGRKGAN